MGVFEAVAAEGEFLEAVFCGEVDGVKLIRSLRTEEQNLVEVIEETIETIKSKKQSDCYLQEAETELTETAECSIFSNDFTNSQNCPFGAFAGCTESS